MLLILFHEAGSRWCSLIIEEVSAGSMVKESQEPQTEMMMAQEMKAPPQPGAMASKTEMVAGLGAAMRSAYSITP